VLRLVGSHAILRPLGKRIEKKLSVLHSGNSNHGRGACRALKGAPAPNR
jgi:hypothetical protein